MANHATKVGLKLSRTWAFSVGLYLQGGLTLVCDSPPLNSTLVYVNSGDVFSGCQIFARKFAWMYKLRSFCWEKGTDINLPFAKKRGIFDVPS